MSDAKKLSEFLAYTVIAISNCSLYSVAHHTIAEFSNKAFLLLNDLFDDDSMNFTLLSGSFIFNGVPVLAKNPHMLRFKKILTAKGIERVVINKGVTFEELKALIISLALRDEHVRSSAHITVGMLEVRFTEQDNFGLLMKKSAGRVNEIFTGVSKFRTLDIRGVEDIVAGFITAIKKEAGVLKSLKPVKSFSAYTYVHETNVAVLTIFQAEALGLEGEVLHDAGLAGLLHDMGKLFVPKNVLEKQEMLDEGEWDIMKQHPVYGALYLSSLPEIPKIAVIAAYEHHLKYDGSGYPSTKIKSKTQHFISQLVAMADTFDALRSKRSYAVPCEIPQILEIFKRGSGREFNPLLVENFINACTRSEVIR